MALVDRALDAARATARRAQRRRPTGAAGAPQAGVRGEDAAAVDPRVTECRRLVARTAMLGAGVSLLPVPGLDMAADAALLARLIYRINLRFGLSEGQIEALTPERKALVYKAIALVGSALVGSAVKRGLLTGVLKAAGVRLTAGQAARVLPLAGNVLTAGVAYLTMRQVLYRHIDDCARVSALLQLAPPSASSSPSG